MASYFRLTKLFPKIRPSFIQVTVVPLSFMIFGVIVQSITKSSPFEHITFSGVLLR